MGAFDGQTIFLTGGGSGLGRGLVDSFLEAGANVAVLEYDAGKVEALQRELKGAPIIVHKGDVRSREDNDACVAAAAAKFGGLDSYVQCAGVTDFTPGLTRLPGDAVAGAFREMMDINVLGSIQGALAAAPELKKSKGSMVFTLSTSGFMVGTMHSIYNITKNALNGVVRQFAYELAPDVRVNAVVPGPIQGSRLSGISVLGQEQLHPEKIVPNMAEAMKGGTPLGIYPTPAEYAPIYLLLADRKGGKLATGSMVFWDTGISLIGPGMPMQHPE